MSFNVGKVKKSIYQGIYLKSIRSCTEYVASFTDLSVKEVNDKVTKFKFHSGKILIKHND
jgi:hypothetical protein